MLREAAAAPRRMASPAIFGEETQRKEEEVRPELPFPARGGAGSSCTPPSAARRDAPPAEMRQVGRPITRLLLLPLPRVAPSPSPVEPPPPPVEPPPSLPTVSPGHPSIPPSPAAFFFDAGEHPTRSPKFLSLLRRLHRGQPRRRRLHGAAASPAPSLIFLTSDVRLLPHIRRSSPSPTATSNGPGPLPHACLAGYAARGIRVAEGGV
jgi:hypothetical protein